MDLGAADLERYARQLILPEIRGRGQKRLKAASVLVVGAGGLGCPAAFYLAAAGVGRIGIADDDRVQVSNLHRQILYTTADAGLPKAEAARARLLALNPGLMIEMHAVRFAADNARELSARYDFIVDGADNFATKFLINDACYFTGKPFSHAGAVGLSGQTMTVDPGRSPCLRCLFLGPPEEGVAPSCAEAGILGPVVGLIGAVQALEALKVLAGFGEPLLGRLFTFDAVTMKTRLVRVPRNPECPLCGARPTITRIAASTAPACRDGAAAP